MREQFLSVFLREMFVQMFVQLLLSGITSICHISYEPSDKVFREKLVQCVSGCNMDIKSNDGYHKV